MKYGNVDTLFNEIRLQKAEGSTIIEYSINFLITIVDNINLIKKCHVDLRYEIFIISLKILFYDPQLEDNDLII